ncbi:MAG: hypothetical protein ACXVGF_04825 [Blastococcus sp.]
MTPHAYPQFQQKLATKTVNLSTDSLKVLLLSAYTYANTHATMADVLGAGTEVTGTGYTAGGQALTSVTLVTSGTTTTLDAADPAWASSTITASFAVFYDAQGGTSATNYPICYWDLGGAQSSSGTTFTLSLNASGLYQVSSS